MSAFLKKLADEFKQRVFVAYKSTLIGLGLSCAILVADQTVQALAVLPKGWAPLAATLVGLLGAALKRKAAEYPAPVPPPAK